MSSRDVAFAKLPHCFILRSFLNSSSCSASSRCTVSRRCRRSRASSSSSSSSSSCLPDPKTTSISRWDGCWLLSNDFGWNVHVKWFVWWSFLHWTLFFHSVLECNVDNELKKPYVVVVTFKTYKAKIKLGQQLICFTKRNDMMLHSSRHSTTRFLTSELVFGGSCRDLEFVSHGSFWHTVVRQTFKSFSSCTSTVTGVA